MIMIFPRIIQLRQVCDSITSNKSHDRSNKKCTYYVLSFSFFCIPVETSTYLKIYLFFPPWTCELFALLDKLDQISSLEYCAQTTLFLVQELQTSTDVIAAMTANKVLICKDSSSKTSLPSMKISLDDDSERAKFLMKLAPRIRRLESDTTLSLSFWIEQTLKKLQDNHFNLSKSIEQNISNEDGLTECPSENDLLLMLGNCMRGLVLIGRGTEVENIFARVAIM